VPIRKSGRREEKKIVAPNQRPVDDIHCPYMKELSR